MDFNNNNTPNGYQNPNGHQNPYGYQYTPPVKAPGSALSSAAMVLGIGAIVTALMMTVYLPFIFGSLAIVLALLSKGSFSKIQSKARAGIICGIIGLFINFGVIGYSFNIILNNSDMMIETAIMYDEMLEEMYGVPSEELLGESMEDTISGMYEMFQ